MTGANVGLKITALARPLVRTRSYLSPEWAVRPVAGPVRLPRWRAAAGSPASVGFAPRIIGPMNPRRATTPGFLSGGRCRPCAAVVNHRHGESQTFSTLSGRCPLGLDAPDGQSPTRPGREARTTRVLDRPRPRHWDSRDADRRPDEAPRRNFRPLP